MYIDHLLALNSYINPDPQSASNLSLEVCIYTTGITSMDAGPTTKDVELKQQCRAVLIPFQSSANKCHHTISVLAAEFSLIW